MLNQDKPWLVALYISGAGVIVTAYIVVGFWIAKWLVGYYAAPRFWIAVGCVAGLILAIINLVLLIIKFVGEDNG
ncbi:ATPase F0F1 [Paenibacillus yanchengensis]|uniref:ATPase F0F1 n=1 Tax=Paenibacillus yanchengensis TaxID=2035833 RepID=A0ABW4YNJ5_9BACL